MKYRTSWTTGLLLLLFVASGMHAAQAVGTDTGMDARRTFSIPSQSLTSALLAFSRQAEIQVMTASTDLHNRTSHLVSGERTSREALTLLLRGTGMQFHVISESAVSIEPEDPGATALPTPQGKLPDPLPDAATSPSNHREAGSHAAGHDAAHTNPE